MWCVNCESDVATEIAADGQSLLCISCGAEVRRLYAPTLHPDTRRAREMMQELSSELSETSPAAGSEPTSATGDSSLRRDASKPHFRIDRPHPTAELARAHTAGAAATAHANPGSHRRKDPAHAAFSGPHFDITPPRTSATPGRGESTWGQLLAYGGVAVLTVGTVLVVWGYLGGPPTYAPTGWLVATAGQMLVLLGVVTLISGGMQQTTHEVTTRVAHLNGRVVRMEQAAQELLRGPHFGKAPQQTPAAGPPAGESASE